MDRMFRIARKWSNETLKKYAELFDGTIVNVSAWKDYDKCGMYYKEYFKNSESYTITNYGEGYSGTSGTNNEIKLNLENKLKDELIGKFNVVFNHTTLEHIYNVQLAFKNLCLLATDAVIVVVPFSQVQHTEEAYKDYWRFTPFAMQKMFEVNNYTMVTCEYNDNVNDAIYLLCIGINNKQLEKYSSKFKKYIIDEEKNVAGKNIGVTPNELIKRLRKK